ncbi:MAG: hypothetical protein R3335_15105 [Anaerolineales bacterium]|nr:hypothetical protein [Anaerolineales bacterium]
MVNQTPQPAPLPHLPEVPADRVLVITRVLAAIIVPILLAAFFMLYLFPDRSGELFAWPIRPPMTAMMLGATYLGGVYFFARVIIAWQWHTVQLGFLPVSAFAGYMGIATILHWDKFTHGFISFQLWALLYFTLPFVIPLVWYLNQRANREYTAAAEARFSRGLRLSIGGVGGVLVVASLILLIFPQAMIPVWPWALTPLTARSLAAMFVLPGFVGLSVAADGRWSAARIIFQAQSLAIVLFLIAMVLNRAEIQWDQWSIWTYLSGLLLVLLLIGWAALQSRRHADHAPLH